MSINSKMQPFKLYINKPTQDGYGHTVDNFIYEREVMVALHFNSINNATGDVRYKDCQYTGLTRHKGLDLKEQYKLVPKATGTPEYLVKSINELSRITQYLLQAVV